MSVYQNIYDLINTYIFGGLIETGSYQDLVTIFFSVAACFLVVAIPFIVILLCVYFICKTIGSYL